MSRLLLFIGLAAGLALVALASSPSAGPLPVGAPVVVPAPAQTVVTPAVTPAPALAFVPVTAQDGVLTLSAKLSNTYVAAGLSEEYLELNVSAAEATGTFERVPVNLALVIDRSGSMSGQKLQEARRAALELVAQLRPEDRLAIVDFGSDVRTLGSQRADASGKQLMRAYLHMVRDEGGTNISEALALAQRLLQPYAGQFKASRVILISDGQPTEGITDSASLATQVSQLRESGLTVSAIGVGVDFNGPLMQDLARRGAGFYGFIDDASALADVVRRELEEASRAVARNVSLEVDLPEGVELVELYGRTAERRGLSFEFPLYDFSPGQSARVTARLKVRAGVKVGTQVTVARVALRYTDLSRDVAARSTGTLVATVSDDPRRVKAMDVEVTQNAHRAQSATQLNLAAAAFERGDRTEAFNVLGNLRKLFGMSADSLAGEDLVALRTRWENTHSAEDIRREAKGIEKKGMKNFGENNAY